MVPPSALCPSWAGSGVRLGVGVPGMAAPACMGWFMRDGKALGVHSPPQSHQGRGGAGQTMTLPSLLTSSSPCKVLDSFFN